MILHDLPSRIPGIADRSDSYALPSRFFGKATTIGGTHSVMRPAVEVCPQMSHLPGMNIPAIPTVSHDIHRDLEYEWRMRLYCVFWLFIKSIPAIDEG